MGKREEVCIRQISSVILLSSVYRCRAPTRRICGSIPSQTAYRDYSQAALITSVGILSTPIPATMSVWTSGCTDDWLLDVGDIQQAARRSLE